MNATNQQQFLYNTVPTSLNTLQTIQVEKERLIVPIIFIPGVMGSNLKVKPKNIKKHNAKKIWCLDNTISLLGWALPYYGDAKARKLELDPDKLRSMTAAKSLMPQIAKWRILNINTAHSYSY